jgi:dipeptidyl aminopeptidase/acylaminoacyl peptidase
MRDASRFAMNLTASVILILSSSNLLGLVAGVTPQDCVAVKYINGVWMNWGGTELAYVVKTPNIGQNRNEYQLYVREIGDKSLAPGKLLIAGSEISNVKWLRDDRLVTMLISIAGIKKLAFVNVETGALDSTIETSENIQDYSTDSAGDTVVYSTTDIRKQNTDDHRLDQDEIASGYRVSLGGKETLAWPVSTISVQRRKPGKEWSPPQTLTIQNPVTHIKTTHLLSALSMSLSPDGNRLLFTYLSDAIPEGWKTDPLVRRHPYTAESLFEILVLHDMSTDSTIIPFNSISPATVPLWANDSSSFLLNGSPPVGSLWEAQDIQDRRASIADGDLFWINADSGEVQEVQSNIPDHREGPLFWQENGDVIIRSAPAAVARIRRFKDSWREVERVRVAQTNGDRFLFLVSNGTQILGTRESLSTPRDLFAYKAGEGNIRLLTDLNPQLRELNFAPTEMVKWSTAGGMNMSGVLFLPLGYVPGTRYPLVINTKGNDGLFTCDSGYIDDPSFAPQPIATSGIMYLIGTRGDDWKFQDEIDNRPQGYPGGIGEAVQMMDIWDSAVDALTRRGLIDPSKVGIIGFSRTGWHVEFDLAHAHTRYAAATAADNVQYSLSEYWLLPGFSAATEQMYGGPPYGKTLENWQRYSISFNLDKIHTPLLMEVMGYGTHDDDQFEVPKNLATRYEIFSGLGRLGKPVEMYYYPDDGHQPEHPKARIASEQRNVDWYRFWLQGFEDPNPLKKNQYERWRALKVLHVQDTNHERPAQNVP